MTAVDDWLNSVDPNADKPAATSGPGMTGEQEQLAAQTISDLESQLSAAQFKIASSSYDAGQLSGYTTQSRLSRRLLNILETTDLDDTRAGRRSFAWWITQATTVHDNTAALAGDSAEWNLSGILWKTASQTTDDVKQVAAQVSEDVKGAVASVGGGFGVGIILAGAVALYIWWKA